MASEWDRFESMLVWLPNHVGDVVMATPALRALRQAWPERRWVAVTRPAGAALLAGGPWAEQVVLDRSAESPRARNLLALSSAIRQAACQAGVLLPNSFRSAAVARWAGVTPLAGYARDGRRWLLAESPAPLRDASGRRVPVPTIDYYLELVGRIGAVPAGRRMALPVAEADRRRAGEQLARAGVAEDRPVVLLNPGAAFGPSKLWPVERFAAVADALIDRHDAAVVINAAPAEREIARAVQRAMARRPAVNLADCENSLGLVKGLAERAAVTITNDTGARHIAAAVGSAVVTLFGSTDPVWARIDYPRERTLQGRAPCAPCQKKRCPLSGQERQQCMRAIPIEAVVEAAEELLSAPAPGGAEETPAA